MIIWRRKGMLIACILAPTLLLSTLRLFDVQVCLFPPRATCECEGDSSLVATQSKRYVDDYTDIVDTECVCECPNITATCETPKSPEMPVAAKPKVEPLLLLSWTAMTMTSETHSQVWFGNGTHPESAFQNCYTRNFLDPDRYPCKYTNNRKHFEESDVILFRGRRIAELPLPRSHPAGQLWLFYEFEPPYKVWKYTNLTKYNGVFNLTSTYSRDSNVPINFDLKDCTRQQGKYSSLAGVDYMSKKTRKVPVAWFASVCQTQSKREQYVKELRKYIDVDIYGKCGDLKCGDNVATTQDQCDEKLLHGANSYKFYLAFENSLCDDYISEKLWRMLKVDIIPIVMGAVDYSNIMPKDSFIDVRDFSSPEELAAYLHKVMADRDLYNNYIRSKNSLACSAYKMQMPSVCHICKTLHEIRHQHKVVYELDTFWGSKRCISPSSFYKTTADSNFDLKTQMQWQKEPALDLDMKKPSKLLNFSIVKHI